jgi:hypothetical protein
LKISQKLKNSSKYPQGEFFEVFVILSSKFEQKIGIKNYHNVLFSFVIFMNIPALQVCYIFGAEWLFFIYNNFKRFR